MSVTDLNALADELLGQARAAHSGRAAETVRPSTSPGEQRTGDRLRETVIALAAGHALSDHESPGEATLQVLRGEVRLTVPGEADLPLGVGHRADIPLVRHGLTATTDAVVLLTVAL
ncbi:cupin [Gordonia iterans]|uniref:Cupin n=1 Tax=Gordonia iterans TaxID=1004901 RepID=A0A2S0KIL0_9ACTN|nr:cupin [Gordonia iterans]AVM01503.1 cupin [Gordonia iterans]